MWHIMHGTPPSALELWLYNLYRPTGSCFTGFKHGVPFIVRSEAFNGQSDTSVLSVQHTPFTDFSL